MLRTLTFAIAAVSLVHTPTVFYQTSQTAFAQSAPEQGRFRAYASDGSRPRISNFSGLPVPRYSSIKNSPVKGRAGPSRDYPVKWLYEMPGLPVVVIRETSNWRKIRDPHGDEVWVHARMLTGDRSTMTMYEGTMHSAPKETADIIARFQSGLVLELDNCQNGWCRVKAGETQGWIRLRQLWGTEDLPG